MVINKGDIVLVRTNTYLAKAIHLGMRLKRLLSLDVPVRTYNHSGIGLGSGKILEAVYKTVKLRDFDSIYSTKDCEIVLYSFDWDSISLESLDVIASHLEGRKYQFNNFLLWAVNILTFGRIWLGVEGISAEKKQYCTETVGTSVFYMSEGIDKPLEKAAHKFFKTYWKVSPNDIYKFCESNYSSRKVLKSLKDEEV